MNNKFVFILTLLFCGISTTYAQSGRLAIEITGGINLPSATWGTDELDLTDNLTDWTERGTTFDLTLIYPLKQKHLSLTSMIRRQVNEVNVAGYTDFYAAEDPSASYSVESGNWSNNQLLFGALVSQSLSTNLSVNFRVLTGIINARRPSVTVFADDTYITQNGTLTTSVAGLLGANLKYQFSNQLYFLINADYLLANPEFNVVDSSNIDGYASDVRFRQNISNANFTLGLGWQF